MDVLSYSASPLTISSIHRTTFPPGGQKMQQVLWGASSHKSVGQLRDREFSKLMIQQDFHHAETA
jgi:hypothetical protein